VTKSVAVPGGMLDAAWEAVAEKMKKYTDEGQDGHVAELHVARIAIEAALLWLSENPRIPTPEELDPLCLRYSWLDRDSVRFGTREWQRVMFLAPDEPAVPEEIKDLMAGIEDMPVTEREREWAKKVVIEAYRRGRSDSFPG
jgi:hypothetical protein